MNSPPKRDGDVPASGPLAGPAALEQTVLGIATPHGSSAAANRAATPSLESSSAALPPSSTIPAAPTIAVSHTAAQPTANASAAALPSPPPRPTRAPNEAALAATLRIEPSAPAVLAPPRPAPPKTAPERTAQGQRTALTADYLREARAAALQQVAQRLPAPDPIAPAFSERAATAQPDSTLAGADDTHPSIAPALDPHPPSVANPASARGFEPVPVVRAPLAESLTNTLGPMGELGGTRNLLPPSSRPRPAPPREHESGAGRWLLLAAVAIVTVAVVSVGGRLWQRYRAHGARQRAIASVEAGAAIPGSPSGEGAAPASHARLANRPAPEPGAEGRVRVVSATPAGAAPAGEPGASSTPESQLAATAARHVLSGNYAEALPLYRQLERGWPDNTAYAAMARLLEKKVGSHSDTRSISPAAPPSESRQ